MWLFSDILFFKYTYDWRKHYFITIICKHILHVIGWRNSHFCSALADSPKKSADLMICLCYTARAFTGDPLLCSVGHLEHGPVPGGDGHRPLPHSAAWCQGAGTDFWIPCGGGGSFHPVLPEATAAWATRHLWVWLHSINLRLLLLIMASYHHLYEVCWDYYKL